MLFYFGLMSLSGANFIMSSFVFSFIQYFSILFLFRSLLKMLFPENYRLYLPVIFVLLSFFLLEFFFFSKDFFYTFYIISNSYHTGSFVMALVCLWLLLRCIHNRKPYLLALLALISLLSVVSDRLFIVQFSAPAFLVCLVYLKKLEFKRGVLLLSQLVLPVVIGLLLYKLIPRFNFASFDNPHKLMALEDVWGSWQMLSGQMLAYMKEFSFRAVTLYLFFVTFIMRIWMVFDLRRQKENWRFAFYILFSLFFDVIVFFAPVLNGNYSGYDTLRYNIYPVYFAVLNTAVTLAYLGTKPNLLSSFKLLRPLFSIIIVFLLGYSLVNISFTGLSAFLNHYPPEVKRMDDVAEELRLKRGVANYWDAKKTTMFSKKGLKVYAVYDDLVLYTHVTNRTWFYSDIPFNFVMLNQLNDTSLYKGHFKNTKVIKRPNGLFIALVPGFKYDRANGNAPVVIE